MNKSPLNRLRGAYLASLRSHCAQDQEADPQMAVEIGRKAVAIGLETLDVARIHAGALAELHMRCDAPAKRADIVKTLSQRTLELTICMTITDDGHGFPVGGEAAAKMPNRLGLLSMRERVEMLGGTFSVTSAPGHATIIRAELPAAAADEPLPPSAGTPGTSVTPTTPPIP